MMELIILLLTILIFGLTCLIIKPGNSKTITYKTKAERIGQKGENKITSNIKQLNINVQIFRNLYVPFSNGTTTEIDIVLLTDKKLYVIESKNYSGIIIGNYLSEYWRTYYPNGKNYEFYNPIKQNQTHINALANNLRISSANMESIICFGDKANIGKLKDYKNVINNKNIKNYILADYGKTEHIFSENEIKEIAEKLQRMTNATRNIKEKHIKDINKKYR